MNDFAIQGVTILGTEISHHVFALFPLIIFALLSLGFVVLICAGISDKEYIAVVVCSLLCMLSIFIAFLAYKEWKAPPETTYTISIDDTASYNQIKNNFYYIRELPNGLYEVKLTENNSQND